jgi:hypothetical protein
MAGHVPFFFVSSMMELYMNRQGFDVWKFRYGNSYKKYNYHTYEGHSK